jgi:DNA-binding NarL/FixJ family response regulator
MTTLMTAIQTSATSCDASTLRVLVPDGPPLLRAGLRAVLGRVEGVTLVGEARDLQDAARQVGHLQPDVVVLDFEHLGPAPLPAIARIASAAPDVHVLVLGLRQDVSSLLGAVRAGARGYVLKTACAEDIVRAIRSVGRGEVTFGAGVADGVLEYIAAAEPRARDAFEQLTGRERDVLALLAQGASTGQIALRLQLSAKTVRNYISIICGKLGVLDRTQAALQAREAGYGLLAAA